MSKTCTFCEIVSGRLPAHLVYRDTYCLAFLDKRPLFHGHTLLVPHDHISTLDQMDIPWAGHFFQILCMLSAAVEKGMGAEGTFVAQNNKISQSVAHLHFHIVPRKKNDGLKGFFWPRHPYGSEEQMKEAAKKIENALKEMRF
ncbi:MAG: HIT family protein [Chitinispirillaceae bacterium]